MERSSVRPTVLLVEDEEPMRRFVRAALTAGDHRVVEAPDATRGLEQARAYNPDLVLLDLGLPDGDGVEVVRALRSWSRVPVVVISARDREEDKIRALDAGADDYLTKPFGAAELLARIRAALRRAARENGVGEEIVEAQGLKVDLARRLVFKDDAPVRLTPIQYRLLAELARHAGMVVTHRQLLADVWGPGHVNDPRYLRVYMAQLRQKLEDNPARPKYLVTEAGVGYRLRT